MVPDRSVSIALRPVRGADHGFLQALYADVRAVEMAALPLPEAGKQQMLEMQFAAQAQGYAHNHPEARHDIIRRGTTDIGQIRVDRQADVLHLVDVSLCTQARGQGIGTGLLRALQDEARAQGLPLRLSVRQDNPALTLYRRLGFAVVPETAQDLYLAMVWTAPTEPSSG